MIRLLLKELAILAAGALVICGFWLIVLGVTGWRWGPS